MIRVRASCLCESTVLLRRGDVVCATCGKPLVNESSVATNVYTSDPGHWPPGACNKRQAVARIRAVPGHVTEGSGKATRREVSVEAYRAFHAKRSVPLRLVPSTTTSTGLSLEQMADAALADRDPKYSCLRATKAVKP